MRNLTCPDRPNASCLQQPDDLYASAANAYPGAVHADAHSSDPNATANGDAHTVNR